MVLGEVLRFIRVPQGSFIKLLTVSSISRAKHIVIDKALNILLLAALSNLLILRGYPLILFLIMRRRLLIRGGLLPISWRFYKRRCHLCLVYRLPWGCHFSELFIVVQIKIKLLDVLG